MLVTLGLERVEAGLRCDAMSPSDVDEILEQAKVNEVDTRPRVHIDEAVLSAARRLTEQESLARRFIEPISVPGLPTREYAHQLANTEFRQTRQPDRV
nr:hypothetical protein [Mycolicibacterium iranicum]